MNVVLDKSYLMGAGRQKINDLCRSQNVLMPESLFYELLTTEKSKERAICFGNLPATDNPVVLVNGVGTILRHEINNRAPISANLGEVCIDVQYTFNKRLTCPDFPFTDEQNETISEWQRDVAARVEGFKEKSACVSGWFPRVKGYTPGEDPQHINKAKSLVCEDRSVVREIYRAIWSDALPAPEMVTEEWALFRYLQVHVFAALGYVSQFGDENSAAISKRIENEMLDLDYCVTALLVGALASRDHGMIDKFTRIRPDGIIMP